MANLSVRDVIAVTMGDPAGIGPEICLKALADHRVTAACTPVIIGSERVLARAAEKLHLPLPHKYSKDETKFHEPGFIDLGDPGEFSHGRVSANCGRAAFQYIEFAIEKTAASIFDAMTTAPICKESLRAASVLFPGHTEILEQKTSSGAGSAVMMLYGPTATVTLVSTHVALREVPVLIKEERVLHTIRLTHHAMLRIKGHAPRIAVLGLNPHAGEGGMFGNEELAAISPAIESAKSAGIDAHGPLAADTAFTPAALKRYDAHVCMYHDQGLTPFKALSFDSGVNVTLGIPIFRTSPAHGTAFDIAWQGVADPSSMVSAILLAVKLIKS